MTKIVNSGREKCAGRHQSVPENRHRSNEKVSWGVFWDFDRLPEAGRLHRRRQQVGRKAAKTARQGENFREHCQKGSNQKKFATGNLKCGCVRSTQLNVFSFLFQAINDAQQTHDKLLEELPRFYALRGSYVTPSLQALTTAQVYIIIHFVQIYSVSKASKIAIF
jgi:hypothetical protein